MPDPNLPTYFFDFRPGITAPAGRAMRRVRVPEHDHVAQLFGYRFNDLPLTQAAGATLPVHLADALDIAGATYIADRYAQRSVRRSRQWHRHLIMRLPVRQAALWASAEYRIALERFLTYLTDDRWSIEFVPRTAPPRRSESVVPLFPSSYQAAPVAVLHSGGLDSCIGIIEAAQAHARGSVLAISTVSHSHPSYVQRAVVSTLRRNLPTEIVWVRLFAGLSGVERSEQESSQRARSFLYLVAGAVAASLAGASQLQVCENGVGAINLPCSPDQISTQNTRAMHPLTLARFSELISLLTHQRLSVWNTALWKTKAELCREFLTLDGLVAAAQQTVSCDRFPWIGPRQACGSCTSCLFRRASLHGADLSLVDGSTVRGYDFDPLSSKINWSGHDQVPLFALQAQCARLRRALQAPEVFPALVDAFPQLTRLQQAAPYLRMTGAEIEEQIIRLVHAYTTEWGSFSARISWPTIIPIDPIETVAVAS